MGISDSNPERRNLTVLAVAIILFYLGGARLVGTGLNLPMVNVEFTRTWALQAALWGALIWFHFRYWQTWKDEGKKAIRDDMESFFHCPGVLKYLKENVKVPNDQKTVFKANGLILSSNAKRIQYDKTITHSFQNGQWKKLQPPKPHKGCGEDITGVDGKLLLINLFFRALVVKGGILAYYSPYVFSFIAVVMGLTNDFWLPETPKEA